MTPHLSPAQLLVIVEARSLIGTRWRHQGRNPERGIDCGGVPDVVATRLGWPHAPFPVYSRYPDGQTFRRYLQQEMVQIPRSAMQPGDVLLLLDLVPGSWPCHCAVVADCTERLTIIHGDAYEMRVVENGIDPSWEAKIVGCFRYKEIAAEVGPWRH